MAPAAVTTSYSTAGTVSSPLDLDALAARGEHESVRLNGATGRRVSPKPKATLTSLTVNNAGTLRKINAVVLPIVYSEKFYKDVLDPELDEINKLVYYADIPVGACCSRLDNLSGKEAPTLTILTLAVLAPYRSQGLGAALVTQALRAALHPTAPPPPTPPASGPATRAALQPAPPRKPVNRALVHVQVGNDAARRFYERLGFKEAGVNETYYSKMDPRAAWILVLDDIAAALGEGANGDSK
ncbi:N-acetyltransferase 5 [Vanrija albida]|uniref:N-acetyltransferase 5 n=1 Tax=Vanrija albida TaxID=181172 RepID=A0ABR3PRM5_9TREE